MMKPELITRESNPRLYEAMMELHRQREANKPRWYDYLLIFGIGSAIFVGVLYSWIWVLTEWAKVKT